MSAALIAVLAAACGGPSSSSPAASPSGGQPAEMPSPSPSASPSAPAETPEAAAARRAADAFLAALVAEDHAAAHGLLSQRAQREVALPDFVVARQQETGSAHSLGRVYRLTSAVTTPAGVTVTGEGLLADGTDARIELPLVRQGQEWRVDRVPTAY